MEKKISISQIKEVAQQAYNEVKGQTGGKNADYIPYLANIDSKLFGLSICLMNGQTINIGDTDYRFGIESVSKVHTAILILRQYGAQKVLDMIGADATGLPFNSIIAILLENDHPSTPLVNAGAISACSMVQPAGNSDKKWDAIVQNITELCGSAPQLIDDTYPAPVRCAESVGYDWRRCNRTAVQLYHRYFAGERPSLYAIGKCRSHFRLLHGTAGRQFGQEMGCHRTEHHRTVRLRSAAYRRTVQIGNGYEFQ